MVGSPHAVVRHSYRLTLCRFTERVSEKQLRQRRLCPPHSFPALRVFLTQGHNFLLFPETDSLARNIADTSINLIREPRGRKKQTAISSVSGIHLDEIVNLLHARPTPAPMFDLHVEGVRTVSDKASGDHVFATILGRW